MASANATPEIVPADAPADAPSDVPADVSADAPSDVSADAPADVSATTSVRPAIDGWFTTGERPTLLGTRCVRCRTVFFPRESAFCRNPGCTSEAFDEVELSRQGRVWSYTDARYQPPPPYIPRVDPYEPFALAAVELEAEGIVVLGQVADGYGVDDLTVGMPVELVVEPLYTDGEGIERSIWRWKPVAAAAPEEGTR